MTNYFLEISMQDICYQLKITEVVCVELVEYGIVEPRGNEPSQWLFSPTMVSALKRAVRLHRDLEMDWAEVALISDLLDEREKLQIENQLLQRRLNRFLID
jgi:chaperone modulatory protein CbpM